MTASEGPMLFILRMFVRFLAVPGSVEGRGRAVLRERFFSLSVLPFRRTKPEEGCASQAARTRENIVVG